MIVEDFQPQTENATALPAADVTVVTQAGPIEHESYPVKKPEEDLNEFKVQVRASTLNRCRAKLMQVAEARFPWHELALGGSTLAGGAFLGALPADIKSGTLCSVVFYTLLPIAAVGAFVAYLFLRRQVTTGCVSSANEILSELPDPHKAR